MFIKKRLTCSITIKDPNDIYNPDPDSVIKKYLDARFKGKCYKSCLILEILEIVKRSHFEFTRQLNANVNVNVCFDVKAVVYHTDEVIHGCKVNSIGENNFMVCESQYAVINLQKNLRIDDSNISNIFKVKQEIPIIVKKARYEIDKNMISIIGIIWIPYPDKLTVYKVNKTELTEDQEKKLAIMRQKIQDEEALHKVLSTKKEYKFFQSIMYPYKSQQKFLLSPIASLYKFKTISLDDLSKYKSNEQFSVAYPSEFHKTDKVVVMGIIQDESKIKEDSSKPVDYIEMNIQYYNILMIIYRKYLDHMTRLRLFCEQMDSLEKIKEFSIYWKIIESRKV